MRAAVWTNYGNPEVIRVKDISKPVPKDNEILVQVKASSVSKADCELLKMDFPFFISFPMRLFVGLVKPKRIKVLGQEISGIVETVGKEVTRFKPGDEVMASTGFHQGGHAEYICLSEREEGCLIALKPGNTSFEEAACVATGAIEAYCFLMRAELKKGQKVMIIGAGGSFGTYAVQLAKYFGTEVTAVDSGIKEQMLRSLGADIFIDFTKTDYTALEDRYDVVFDIVCVEKYSDIKNILKNNAVYLAGNPKLNHFLHSSKRRKEGKPTVFPHSGDHSPDDLEIIKNLIEQNNLKVQIDTVFKLDDIIDAFQLALSGNKQGNIVINELVSSAMF